MLVSKHILGACKMRQIFYAPFIHRDHSKMMLRIGFFINDTEHELLHMQIRKWATNYQFLDWKITSSMLYFCKSIFLVCVRWSLLFIICTTNYICLITLRDPRMINVTKFYKIEMHICTHIYIFQYNLLFACTQLVDFSLFVLCRQGIGAPKLLHSTG